MVSGWGASSTRSFICMIVFSSPWLDFLPSICLIDFLQFSSIFSSQQCPVAICALDKNHFFIVNLMPCNSTWCSGALGALLLTQSMTNSSVFTLSSIQFLISANIFLSLRCESSVFQAKIFFFFLFWNRSHCIPVLVLRAFPDDFSTLFERSEQNSLGCGFVRWLWSCLTLL